MYSEFRFREAYKFTVEHSVYVNNDFHGKELGKYYFKINSTEKKQGLHYDQREMRKIKGVDFHENSVQNGGNIKESGFKFDRWLHSVLCN
jgi:phosphinothricin acetyltransferase